MSNAGEVMTAASDSVAELPRDTSIQQSSTVVSDSCQTSEVDSVTSSRDDVSVTACVTCATSTVAVTASSTADVVASFQSKLQESDSTDMTGVHRQPLVESSKTSEYVVMSGSTSTSENHSVSANQTVTVHEYCQAFEQWTWQYYWWMQHIHWITWAAYMSTPMTSCITSTSGTGSRSAVLPTPPARLLQQQQQPVPQQPAPHVRG